MEEGGATGQGRGLAAGWQGLIACLAGTLLYVLAFPPFRLPEAAYVFALPFLLWGLFGQPAKREGLLIYVSGWLAWLYLISWLRNCTSGLDMPFAGLLGWFITVALAAVLGLFWWAWVMVALRTVRQVKERPVYARLAAMLGMAGLWVVLEWVRG
ncbi:MAG: hypothetical protein AB3N33_07210, partial [Puniceicoccaceae bacterium]